jgi:adenylate cyclase
VVEGSVRKAGNRVRITGQLIDAETGHHVWAERYDRVLDDIFDLQDEITDSIVGALEPAVGKAEMIRATRKPTENLDAWDLYQRGMWHFQKTTKEDFGIALELAQRARELDPKFAGPLAVIACVRIVSTLLAWSENPAEALSEGYQLASEAIGLDDAGPLAHAGMSYALTFLGRHDEAIAAARRTLEVNPSFAMGYHALGVAHMFDGGAESAIEAIERAIRISPQDPWSHIWLVTVSAANYMARNYDAALELARLAVQRAPNYPLSHRTLASALAQLGRLDEARKALDAFLALSPNYSAETARHAVPFRRDEDFGHYMEGLRIAGWQG